MQWRRWTLPHNGPRRGYASRTESQLKRQRQIRRLRHIIRKLGRLMNEDARESPEVKKLLEWACDTTMHVVQLKMPRFDGDDYAKDIDFSADGVQTSLGCRLSRSAFSVGSRSLAAPGGPGRGYRGSRGCRSRRVRAPVRSWFHSSGFGLALCYRMQ
ncbi:DUF3734 domain-containing protein [Burkholderia contaminans]|uniref:DUF3734 domain-containing protein n=1 Tax=Burkholderia contaminans TaxID=488447 RepID=UPI003110AF24